MKKKLKIAFCASEVFPFAKTGGLADVCGALPKALAKAGCQVKVFMPWYKNVKPQVRCKDYGITKEGNLEFIFIAHNSFFFRDGLYGTPHGDYGDNLERFVFFNKQIFHLLKVMKFKPDIIHCNDWQTALMSIYLKADYKDDKFFKGTKSILTIHNISYQGVFSKDKFQALGLSWDYFTMHKLEFYDKINLLKGGIVFSDMINTVSPTYAKEIKTKEYAYGLEGVLIKRGDHVKGICNAIDYKVWNPQTDKYIYKKYSLKTIKEKACNKDSLQKELGLKVDKNIMLLGMVSRLTQHKGLDILVEVLPEILSHFQVVILGFGDHHYHTILKKIEEKFRHSLVVNLTFDENFAHRIYASSDGFLMPSHFEPCGLSQMISYKYAAVPIVHATGGLADTVIDYSKGGGGFVFHQYSSQKLKYAIDRAGWLFSRKEQWNKLLRKIIAYDFSWPKTAKKYQDMYSKILN